MEIYGKAISTVVPMVILPSLTLLAIGVGEADLAMAFCWMTFA